jgi:hypothetical protein
MQPAASHPLAAKRASQRRRRRRAPGAARGAAAPPTRAVWTPLSHTPLLARHGQEMRPHTLIVVSVAWLAAVARARDPTAAAEGEEEESSPLSSALMQLLAAQQQQQPSHAGAAAAGPSFPDTRSALAALSRQKRRIPPPTGGWGGRDSSRGGVLASLSRHHPSPPTPVCPAELGAQVNVTGLLSVDLFRRDPNGSQVSCDDATRLAINMSRACGGSIYFGTACTFESTVIVPGGTSLKGGGNSPTSEFLFRPQTVISGPRHGPAFLVEHTTNVQFEDLQIAGHNTGVVVTDSAVIRFVNVAIRADYQGLGRDNVNLTAAGCDGCNVVLGSNNTALVIENAFCESLCCYVHRSAQRHAHHSRLSRGVAATGSAAVCCPID